MTLVELLVAMSVFGVVLAAVVGALVATTRSVGAQAWRAAATRVASGHIEQLRAVPFDDLEDHAGEQVVVTAGGREFTTDTTVRRIDAQTGEFDEEGDVKQIDVAVSWRAGSGTHRVAHTTAVRPDEPAATTQEERSIGQISMFPSPVNADADGRPLENVDVTVPLEGFDGDEQVHLSWSNHQDTDGAKTLLSSDGRNWTGTISADSLRAELSDGEGEIDFSVQADDLTTRFTLAVREPAETPPAIVDAAISEHPITVASPAPGRNCADRNQCENTADAVMSVEVEGLDAAEDSVVLQYQLFDGTFQELPLTPDGTDTAWSTTVRRNTTKFMTGSDRPFRFIAIRSEDGATTGETLLRDVVRQ